MVKNVSILLVLILALAAPLAAQERPGRAQRGRANAPANDMRMNAADVMKVLDGYAIVEAQSALELGEAQYPQFVTRLRVLQDTRRRNQQARNRIVQELRRLAGPQATETPDENTIRQHIKALRDLETKATDEVRKAYDALDEVLDARQQARFRLFEERLELRKMDLLMRARQGAAQRSIR